MNSDGSTCHQRSTTELNEALVNADISNSYEEFLAVEGLARDLRAGLRSSPDRRTSYFY